MDAGERAERAHAYENPRRVLDLGCASGVVGAALKARQGCEVVGIELDPAYAADAADRLDRVVRGDLDVLASGDAALLDLGRFDCLLAGDVLEHLRDPWLVLGRFAGLLDPGGAAVVSLPNVRFWETFWQVGVRGTWPQHAEGIFDRTHLRWFTLRDAWALLEGAGLRVEAVRRVARLRPDGEPDTPAARTLAKVPGVRPFVTFQHVLRARR
jgi:2-polyprenyl-3-methyl-5-hydroxy-6-metoxy-1,4-benzoquinol methylase